MIPLAAFMALAQQCAPAVAPPTMAAVVRVESAFNPYAIGVVHGRLQRQPASIEEAVVTARALDAAGWDYSVGLAQLNRSNWMHFGLTPETAFDPCRNLAAGAAILQSCFGRARRTRAQVQDALRDGLSCYASGDFSTGYRTGYVQRVVADAGPGVVGPVPVVPAIGPTVSPIPGVPVTPATTPTGSSRPGTRASPAGGSGTGHATGLSGDMTQESAVVF